MLDSDCRALTRTCPASRTPHAGQKAQKVTTSTNQPQNGIGPPPKDKPMTDTPDDLPSPDEFRRKMAHVDQEFADAAGTCRRCAPKTIRRSVR